MSSLACIASYDILQGADESFGLEVKDELGNMVPVTGTAYVTLYDKYFNQVALAEKQVYSSDEEANWPAGLLGYSITHSESALLSPGIYGFRYRLVEGGVTTIEKAGYLEVKRTAVDAEALAATLLPSVSAGIPTGQTRATCRRCSG